MYWGNKVFLADSIESDSNTSCKVCKKESKHVFRLFQRTFSLAGLSFFPTSKEIKSTCTSCSFTKRVQKKRGEDVIDANEMDELLARSKPKLKYYTGLLILGLLVAFLVISALFGG